MALNLGDINFGLGVDSRRLRSSVNDVVKFGQAVETAANRTGKGAKTVENALRKQEQATLDALQKTLKLNQSLRSVNAPTAKITESTRAFRELKDQMVSGQLTALEYQRVQERFAASTGKVQRDLTGLSAKLRQTQADERKAAQEAANTERAMLRQQQAIFSASQSVEMFNARLARMNSTSKPTANLIRANQAALDQLTASLSRGAATSRQMQAAQQQFASQINRSKIALDNMRTSTGGISNLSDVMRELASSAVLISGPLGGIAARLSALSAITGRVSIAFAGMIAGFAGAGLALTALSRGAVTTALEMDRVRARLESVTGSTVLASAKFQEIKTLADATGQSFVSLSNQYAKLASAAQGTALEGQRINKVFEDITFAAAKFRLPAEQVDGVLKAIEQIMSKGTVQAEELRGQLGDRLPGAFQIATRAMGVTTAELNKMLKQGQVLSEDFLPKFATELRKAMGAEATTRVEGLQASLGRLKNATDSFNDTFDRAFGISKLYQSSIETLTSTIEFFGNNLDTVAGIAGAVTGALLILAGPRIVAGFVAMTNVLKTTTAAMLALNTATLANPLGGLAAILTRIGVVAVGAAAGYATMQSALNDTSVANARLIDSIDSYIKSQEEARKTDTVRTGEFVSNTQKEIDALRQRKQALIDSRPQATIRADDRNALQRQFDKLVFSVKYKLDLLEDPNGDRKREIEQINQALGEYQTRLQELQAIEAEQKRIAQERIDAQKALTEAALEGANTRIARILEEANAIQQGGGAVQALRAEFAQTDAIEKFQLSLEKAKFETEIVTQKTQEFAAALRDLDDARASAALDRAAEQIRKITEEAEATKKGTAAVETLKAAFERTEAIDAFRQRLEAAGISAEEVERQVDNLTSALNGLNAAASQARIDDSLNRATSALQRVNQETQALAKGKDAFEAFKSSTRINDQTASFREGLLKDGVAIEEVTRRTNEYRSALEANAAARAKFDASNSGRRGRRSGGGRRTSPESQNNAIVSATQQIDRLNMAVDALRKGPEAVEALQRQFNFDDQIQRFRESLERTGISQDIVNQKTREYQAALTAVQAAQQGARLQEVNEQLGRMALTIEAMKQGPKAVEDLQKAFEKTDAIESFRDRLVQMGLSQEQVNEKMREFIALTDALEGAKPKFDAFKEFFDTVEDSLTSGADNISKALADMALDGEFSLSSLADISKQVASEILSAFIKLAIIKPLLNSIFGAFGGGTGPIPLPSILPSRKGNAFMQGEAVGVNRMRKGGLVTRPTLFGGMASNTAVLAGEAGDEAIMPLVRSSSGDLGVRSVGGGGGSTFNFNFPKGTDVKSFMKAESQMAALATRVNQRGSRNG